MNNEKRLIFEVQMLNTKDRDTLKKLETNGILKRIKLCKDGSIDMRTVKK